ncbi:MAG: hypothetical protein KGV50_01210 [Gammaproteobacteria bacterium]|nr:hypothetical protein [Gammaproteobacteria bacterium]
MRKKNLIILCLLIVLPPLLLIYYLYDTNQPLEVKNSDPVKTSLTSVDPLQYAFITEKNSTTVAVVDVYENKLVGKLKLQDVPDLIAVSFNKRMLYYSKKNGSIIYFLDLFNGDVEEYSTGFPITKLSAKSDGNWLVYGNNQKTTLLNTITKSTQSYDTTGPVSLVYQPNSDNKLFIGEESVGKLSSIDLSTGKQTVLLELPHSISPLSIMPNGLALFFNSNNMLYRYGLLDNKATTFDLGGTAGRPYVTNDSRRLMVLSNKDDELISFNTYTLKEIIRHKLTSVSTDVDNLASGWLESVGIVIGKSLIQSFDFEENKTNFAEIAHPLNSIFIHPDSKTLYAISKGSSQMIVFDLVAQKIVTQFDTELSQPQQIIMLQSNTLCH